MDVSDKFSEDLLDLLNIHNELYELSGYEVYNCSGIRILHSNLSFFALRKVLILIAVDQS